MSLVDRRSIDGREGAGVALASLLSVRASVCVRAYQVGYIADDKSDCRSYRGRVGALRYHLAHRRIWTMWLMAAALLMKVAVPAGYMPVVSNGWVGLALCSGFGPEKMAMAMPAMSNHRGKAEHSERADMPCGFAGHAPASMAGADPILLLVAIAFIVATISRLPISPPFRRIGYLRPHLRGPPAI